MKNNKNLLIISGSLSFMGYGLLSVLVPVSAKLNGYDDYIIGLIGVIFYIGLLSGSFLCPKLVQRVGHARAYTFVTGIWALTPILFFLIKDINGWVLLMGVVGFCFSTNRMIIESWLNDITTERYRVYTISTYIMMIFICAAIGQNILNLGEPHSFTLFGIVAVLLIISSFPINLTTTAIPKPPKNISLNILWGIRLAPIAILACFCNGLINSAHITFSAVFIMDKDLSVGVAAAFMSSITAGGAILQIPFSFLYSRIGFFLTVICLCLMSMYIAYILQNEISYAYWYVILGFVFGGCVRPIYSMSVSFANSNIAKEDMVRMSGITMLVYSLGSLVGAGVMAFVSSSYGVKHLFFYMLVIQALLLVFIIAGFLFKRRSKNDLVIRGVSITDDLLNPRLFA